MPSTIWCWRVGATLPAAALTAYRDAVCESANHKRAMRDWRHGDVNCWSRATRVLPGRVDELDPSTDVRVERADGRCCNRIGDLPSWVANASRRHARGWAF